MLPPLGDDGGAVEGDGSADGVQGVMQDRRVGVATYDLGVGSERLVVHEIEKLGCDVPADAPEDRPDLRVRQGGVEVGRPIGPAARSLTQLAPRVFPHLRAYAEGCLQRADSSGEPIGKLRGSAPGGRQDADGVIDAQRRREKGSRRKTERVSHVVPRAGR